MRLPLNLLRRLFCRENLWALLVCLVILAVIIVSSGSQPLWIYQGF